MNGCGSLVFTLWARMWRLQSLEVWGLLRNRQLAVWEWICRCKIATETVAASAFAKFIALSI